ncbi:MAG: nuclear transport factor 2 family protein [Chlorobiota bacterium]|jgi:hypothetical protein|nr:nuclear transport factor 2 family protein [Chlorobiota bacterium]QQS66529.1 MAG: nuclear transport factor 2 family protein [Chlorobiota bacterium]
METANQFIEIYYGNFIQKEWDQFSDKIHNDFLYFTDHCKVQNKHEFIEYLSNENWLGTSFMISDFSIIPSKDKNLLICTYRIDFYGLVSLLEFNLKALETTVLLKENDDFSIIHCHSSNIKID